MSMADASPWSAQQHEWLSALGHTVYLPGHPELDAGVPATVETHVRKDAEAVEKAPPARRPPVAARPAAREPATPAPAAHVPPTARATRLPDRLHIALIRASGCNPNAAESAAIFAGWPATAELRNNPAAKRALWPQLRALRKQARPQ